MPLVLLSISSKKTMQKRGIMAATASRAERDEDLALFHDMHKRDRERKSNAIYPVGNNGDSRFVRVRLASSSVQHRMAFSAATTAAHKSTKTGDDLLTADLGKNDYDWLLTPPDTPMNNPLDHNSSANGDDFLSQAALPNLIRSLAAIKTSRLLSSKSEATMKKEPSAGALLSMRPDPALKSGRNGLYRSTGVAGNSVFTTNNLTSTASKRSSLAPGSRPASRPTTPTKRPTISSTPVSRPTTPTSRPRVASTPASRPTTPTSRPKVSSTPAARPTTPTSRPRVASTPASRPTTPTSRPTIASTSRSGNNNVPTSSMMTTRAVASSRPTTPARRPGTPQTQTQSLSAGVTRSSSISKGRPVPSRSTPSSRGSSPTLKPHAWQQLSAIPGFSLEPPPNLRTSLSTRSTSNSRGASVGSSSRAGSSTAGTTTVTARVMTSSASQSETAPDVSTRQSCSPSQARGRSAVLSVSTSDSRYSSASSIMSRNGGKLDKSPSEIAARGTKAVEKMIVSRKPIASSHSPETTLPISQVKHLVKPATPTTIRDSAGYGRNMSRKSIDLSMRHMDLRQSTSNGLRSLVSNIPTSALYSVRPAGTRARLNNSPMATSSNASSDYGMSIVRDPESSELGEEFIGEVGNKASPVSQPDSLSSLVKDARVNNWLGSPEYRDGNLESMQVFRQGIEKFAGCESPLVCPHGGVAVNCDLCNVKIRLQKLNEKCRASLRASLQSSDDLWKGSPSNDSVPSPDQH